MFPEPLMNWYLHHGVNCFLIEASDEVNYQEWMVGVNREQKHVVFPAIRQPCSSYRMLIGEVSTGKTSLAESWRSLIVTQWNYECLSLTSVITIMITDVIHGMFINH
ncbi:hypothetical protein DMENIID0001_035090 [Sergentomyia squamirostris]